MVNVRGNLPIGNGAAGLRSAIQDELTLPPGPDHPARCSTGCSTAYVLFDSVYAEPAAGFRQELAIGITWTREHGRWLVLADQNTEATRLPGTQSVGYVPADGAVL